MTFDTAFERSHKPNSIVTNDKDKVVAENIVNAYKSHCEARLWEIRAGNWLQEQITNGLTTTRLEAARDADERATRNFRWAYQLLLALAKRRLADANAERVNKNDWPAGQQWHEMNGTSHSIFLRRAREEAGIPDDAFLGVIRSLECDIEDLYEAAANTIE